MHEILSSEIGVLVAQDGLEFLITCLHLPRAGIPREPHHPWLYIVIYTLSAQSQFGHSPENKSNLSGGHLQSHTAVLGTQDAFKTSLKCRRPSQAGEWEGERQPQEDLPVCGLLGLFVEPGAKRHKIHSQEGRWFGGGLTADGAEWRTRTAAGEGHCRSA